MTSISAPRAQWTIRVAIAVAIALLAACSGGGTSSKSSSSGGGSPTLVERLAGSGVATYSSPEATTPVVATDGTVALGFLQWQVDEMERDIGAQAGFSGAELDRLAPVEADQVPASLLLATYVADGSTPGSVAARELMGDQPFARPVEVVFPTAVLALFAAEVVRAAESATVTDASGASTQTGSGPGVPSAALARSAGHLGVAAVGGLCTGVQVFVERTLKGFFDLLSRLQPPQVGSILGIPFLTNLVQGAIDVGAGLLEAGKFLVINGVRVLTKPVLDAVAVVAGTVATVAMIVTALRPWTPRVTMTPDATSKVVAPEASGLPGQATVTVSTGSVDWPPEVVDCASAVNISLPSLQPVGAPVTWKVEQVPLGLVTVGAFEPALAQSGAARLQYATNQEASADGPARQGQVVVQATVTRPELDQLVTAVGGLIFKSLSSASPIVSSILEPILRPRLNALLAGITKVVSVQAVGRASVAYHDPPAPPPAQSSSGPRPLVMTTTDPCDLLTPPEVATIYGDEVTGVRAPELRGDPRGLSVVCYWTGSTGTIAVTVHSDWGFHVTDDWTNKSDVRGLLGIDRPAFQLGSEVGKPEPWRGVAILVDDAHDVVVLAGVVNAGVDPDKSLAAAKLVVEHLRG